MRLVVAAAALISALPAHAQALPGTAPEAVPGPVSGPVPDPASGPVSGPVPPTDSTANLTLDALHHLIDRGHAAQALQELDRREAQTPVPAGVDRLRGVALYSLGRLPEAETAFAKAFQQDSQDREAEQMRGITLFRLGRPAAAIPLLEASRAAGPADAPVDPSYVLALCYLDTRRYDEARAAFARQFGFPPDSAQAYLLGARMLLRREYVPVAQAFARKALELQPQLPQAHLLLGETELAGNHLDEAVAELSAERTLNPLEPAVYDRLGDAYTRKADYAQARQVLQEAVLLEPNATGPFILLGKVLLKQGDAAGAGSYLEHARSMDPQNYMAHSLLGQAYRAMGRVDEAKRETDTAQKLQADSEPKLGGPH